MHVWVSISAVLWNEHCAKVLEHNAIIQAIEAYKIEGK